MNFLANPIVWINLAKALNICYGMNCISPEFLCSSSSPLCDSIGDEAFVCVYDRVSVC